MMSRRSVQAALFSFGIAVILIAFPFARIAQSGPRAFNGAGSGQAPAPAASNTPAQDDPATMHDAGVYAVEAGHLVLLDAGTFSQMKQSGLGKSMLTGGLAKTHQTEAMSGSHSPTQITDANPVFYIYFDQNNSSMYQLPGPTSPSDYTLVRLEVKGNNREMDIMSSGARGTTMGPDDQHKVLFTFTKVATGIYKITLNAPLSPGEYCFAGSANGQMMMMMGGHVYDFGFATGH